MILALNILLGIGVFWILLGTYVGVKALIWGIREDVW